MKRTSQSVLAMLLFSTAEAVQLRDLGATVQEQMVLLNQHNQFVFDQGSELVQLSQDDLDDSDVAAFSFDMSNKADEFKTLGQIQIEKKEAEEKKAKEEKRKKEEKIKAEKKKKEEQAKAEKKKQEIIKRQKEMAKKEQEERDKREKEIDESLHIDKNGKHMAQLAEDTSVMKAYSLAIA